MYISNDNSWDYHFLNYNQWLKSSDTHKKGPTNQNLWKVPKVVKSINKKMLL